MANNLTSSTTLTSDQLVSVNRPVLIDFHYSTGDDIPVICEMQCWGNVGGDWVAMGKPLFVNRESDSTPSAPRFIGDFSEILARGVGDTFKKKMMVNGVEVTTWIPATEGASAVEQKNNDYYTSAEGTTSCLFTGVSWYVDDGLLKRSGAAEIDWNTNYVHPINVLIPPSFVNGDSFSNLIDFEGKILNGIVDGSSLNASLACDKVLATNVPRGLTRKIHKDHPVPLGLIVSNKLGTNDFYVSITGALSANGAPEEFPISLKSTQSGVFFRTYLNTFNVMAGNLPSATYASDIRPLVSLKIHNGVGVDFESLRFEVTDSSSSYEKMKVNARAIYWINDFNCLDYFLFDGTTEISYENKSTAFIKNKDYKVGRETNIGVHTASSTEHITIKTTPQNKDVLIWLQEIGRSSAVFEYEPKSATFLPIVVKDFKTKVLGYGQDSYFTEISYVKSTLAAR